jgi:hypothetical protein
MPTAAEKQRRYRSKHRERVNALARKYQRRRRSNDPSFARKQNLRAKYGLTLEQFDAWWTQVGGRCEVCGQRLERRRGGHAIDHDHATGALRGLLCNGCNIALGMLREDIGRVLALGVYIEKHAAQAAGGQNADEAA